MGRPSRYTALVAALAMLAPSLAASLVAVHVTRGHHDDVVTSHPLAIVLHGHARRTPHGMLMP